MRILDNDGAGNRLRVFDRLFEFAFDDVLDLLVDGQHQIVAGLGLLLDAREPFLAGIHGNLHAARLALKRIVVFALDAAQAFVIGADVAEHLGRELSLGIEALRFFLKVDALQVQGANSINDVRVGFSRDPAESLVSPAVGQHHARVPAADARNQRDGIGQIGNLAGNGEGRIDQDRHGERVALAVVDDTALGGDIHRALLLLVGALLEISVAENLKVNQAQADGAEPQDEQTSQKVEPVIRTIAGDRHDQFLLPFLSETNMATHQTSEAAK